MEHITSNISLGLMIEIRHALANDGRAREVADMFLLVLYSCSFSLWFVYCGCDFLLLFLLLGSHMLFYFTLFMSRSVHTRCLLVHTRNHHSRISNTITTQVLSHVYNFVGQGVVTKAM